MQLNISKKDVSLLNHLILIGLCKKLYKDDIINYQQLLQLLEKYQKGE